MRSSAARPGCWVSKLRAPRLGVQRADRVSGVRVRVDARARAAAPRTGLAGAAARAAPAGSPPSAGSAAALAGEIGARLGVTVRTESPMPTVGSRRMAWGEARRREIRSRAGCASAAPSVSRDRSVERSSRKAWSSGAPPSSPLSGAGGWRSRLVTVGGRAGPRDRIVTLARWRVPGTHERRRRVRRRQLRHLDVGHLDRRARRAPAPAPSTARREGPSPSRPSRSSGRRRRRRPGFPGEPGPTRPAPAAIRRTAVFRPSLGWLAWLLQPRT